ncbi:MAG TPA: molybdopterin oxidoreductase family protein, partial [Vicinamibacterales bacterium]|nr:molybdopterin oxidoreductase family protein [Vicinamibacterales bacterium]
LATEGPDGVAIYNSGQLLLEEYYTLGKIARGGLGIANIDANTRLCTATTASSLMENFGADGPPGAYEDLERTECIVLVGHNAAEQSTVLWMRILAAKAGPLRPKVIVIDPRRTFTVTTGADLHVQLKPGTNVALLNGICHLLIENGWIDRGFIERHTVKFDELREIVGRYPPERVESLCGVPASTLRQAAEWIGTSRSTVTTCLQGVYQSNQATAAACAVNNMHLLMGKIGRPGCAPLQFAGQPSSMNTREVGADGTYPAYRNWEDQNHMLDLAKRWKVPVEMLGKKPVGAPEIFELCELGYVKVLWNICTNPAVSMTDRTKQLRTLNGLFLVVQDCFANTETAQLADVILPAAMWGEKTGCMTNAERRCTLLRKAVDPPGEARADLDIFLDFADRMNLRDADGHKLIGYTDPEGAFDEWRSVSRGCIPDYSGMSYARLAETGGLQWPCTAEKPDGTVRLYEELSFPTHWYVSESFEKDIETGHEHTLQEYREKRDPKGRAVLVATDYESPLDLTDDEFPLIAISGRQVYHWHTRTKTGKAPALHEAAPSVFVSVSTEDADRLGIADGDSVRIVSRRGAVVAPAKVGDVVSSGVVFIPFHYGELGEDHAANNLMPKMWDPVSKQAIQKVAAVRLERLGTTLETRWWQDK